MEAIERISIEVTNRCDKACWFCYNHSHAEADTRWTPDELVEFVRDCSVNGVKAVSFGGGEPLQYEGIFEVISRLQGCLFRSMTTNGLLLDSRMLDRMVAAGVDKVHVSIHFPGNKREVNRIVEQVGALSDRGIKSGVNLLVQRSKVDSAALSAKMIRDAGIGNDRIVYLPMRSSDTPTPKQIAEVAGNEPFQSMTCLSRCGKSPRFCSISWDKQVGWCSYTESRNELSELSYQGLSKAVDGLGLRFCGDVETMVQLA